MATYELVGILGSGAYFPKQEISINELALKHNISYKYVQSEHGIKTIHVASQKETEIFMAEQAAKAALKNAKINAEDIDLVISCTSISLPGSSSGNIIESCKFTNAYGFDIAAGFMSGLIAIQVADDIIRKNPYVKVALVVAAHEFEELYYFGGDSNRIRTLVFGDGAAAVILSTEAKNNKIVASNFIVDHNKELMDDLLQKRAKQSILQKIIPTSGTVVKLSKSPISIKFNENITANAAKVLDFCVKSVNLDIRDINKIIKTQLSLKETEMLCEKLKVDKNMIINASVTKGYLGHADIIANLHYALTEIPFNALDLIALLASSYDCSTGAIILRR